MPPSDDEAQAFAASLEKTLATGNIAAINAAFNFDTLLRRGISGIDIPEDVRQNLIAGTMADLMGPDGLAAGIVRAVAQGDRYRLLHVHRHGDEQRALFRTTTANGGFDYLDFILLRDADGKVHAGDFYDYVNGELESEDLHRQVPRIVVQASPDFLWKLPPTDREYVLHQSDVEQMRTLVAARKYREALGVYQAMPEPLKTTRVCCNSVFSLVVVYLDNWTKGFAPTRPHRPPIRGSTFTC